MNIIQITFNTILLMLIGIGPVKSYTNFYTLPKGYENSPFDEKCEVFEQSLHAIHKINPCGDKEDCLAPDTLYNIEYSTKTVPMPSHPTIIKNPIVVNEGFVNAFLFGNTSVIDTDDEINVLSGGSEDNKAVNTFLYPSGNILRAERFADQIGVHMPDPELILKGFSRLHVTQDHMQTAVDAFFIIIYGDIDDIINMPSEYILNSARTIAMMNIPNEKLTAMWTAVKGQDGLAEDVTYETLERFRPLMRYVNAKEIARLNLKDERILSFLGSHPGLDRHQVGVIASVYIKDNQNWAEPASLNLMKNLICGIPITHMRKIPYNVYLQLNYQVFYHIKACDQLQRRFFLAMMSRPQALGKPFSWSAGDVMKLGLLLTELKGKELASIAPEAMAGFTSQVMLAMSVDALRHMSDLQLKYIPLKPRNILTRKLKTYQDHLIKSKAEALKFLSLLQILLYLIILYFK